MPYRFDSEALQMRLPQNAQQAIIMIASVGGAAVALTQIVRAMLPDDPGAVRIVPGGAAPPALKRPAEWYQSTGDTFTLTPIDEEFAATIAAEGAGSLLPSCRSEIEKHVRELTDWYSLSVWDSQKELVNSTSHALPLTTQEKSGRLWIYGKPSGALRIARAAPVVVSRTALGLSFRWLETWHRPL